MIKQDLKKRAITSLVLLLLLFLIFKFNFILIYALLILSVISIIEFLGISKKIIKSKLIMVFLNTFFISYIIVISFLFFFFTNFSQLKILTFCLLLCCIASDIGGYAFGKIFKGPKLTKISPNKTISGSIGSITLSSFAFLISIFYFTDSFSMNFLVVGILTSVACQVGDLIFSLLKRKAELKDTGNFLPGHGGVLDRIDGILLGVPIGFLTLILVF